MHLPGCVSDASRPQSVNGVAVISCEARLRANGGLVWPVALNLVLGSSISWEGVGVVLGNRSQRKNPATQNRGLKHQYPKCFVVNYVLPVVIALLLFEMLDGHGLPPFKRSKGMPLFRRNEKRAAVFQTGAR
jgi:hypothetical protein